MSDPSKMFALRNKANPAKWAPSGKPWKLDQNRPRYWRTRGGALAAAKRRKEEYHVVEFSVLEVVKQ